MNHITHWRNDAPADAPATGWQGLNADQRGEDGHGDKPSLTISDAAGFLTRAGLSWSALGQGAVVTFAFRATSGPLPLDVSGFARFTSIQIEATLLALQAWSDVADITFVRQDAGGGYSDNAAILFGNYSSGADGAAAFASLPGSTAPGASEGDVWVNRSLAYNALPTMGTYGHLALVHEIGHAIGLLHPGDYNAAPGVDITYGAHASYREDSNQYTVMSYFSETSTGAGYGPGRYASAPLLDDIAAAQRLYGANLETRTGDTVYGFNSTAERPWFSADLDGAIPVFAVWDAGGADTFDFSGYSGSQVIDLRQGGFSSVVGGGGNVSIAVGAVIENAIGGAGDDQIYGNSGDNRLTPGAGHNRVDGGLGVDTVVFAGPQSAYTVTWSGPDCFVSGPEGSSRVRNVEFLAFSDGTIEITAPGGLRVNGDITDDIAHGSAFSDTINGSDGDDHIYGLEGHDQLVGGRGNDFIDGGADNDTIYVDQGDDTLIGGDGEDILELESSRTGVVLDLEAGTMTGDWSGVDQVSGIERVYGSRHNDFIRGDAADNYIQGGGGVDAIHGGGGDDELVGSWKEAGGAEDVVKGGGVANGSVASAVSLDLSFDRLEREGVYGFGQPTASVVATTHGGFEYYAFTAGANADVVVDIDGASFDSVIRIFDASGTEIASNDDGRYGGDGGSATDSFLLVRLPAAGIYYVQVGAYTGGSGSSVQSGAIGAGQTYTLHVTVPGHETQPTHAQGSELHGDEGADILRGTVGRDVLDGGSGDDLIYADRGNDVIRGGEGWDTLHFIWDSSTETRLLMVGEDEYLLKGPEGADLISGIEVIRFSNISIDLARLYALGAFDGRPDGLSLADLIAGDSLVEEPLVLPGADGNGKSAGPPPVLPPMPEVPPGSPDTPDAGLFELAGPLPARIVWSQPGLPEPDWATSVGERVWDWAE